MLKVVASESPGIPLVLEHQLRIAIDSAKVSTILGQHESTASGLLPNPFPVIRLLDNCFTALETRYSTCWSFETEISFLKAKLQLYSFAIFRDDSDSVSEFNQTHETPEFITLSHSAATCLICKICSSTEEIPFWTSNIYKSVFYAVFVLLKICELLEENTTEYNAARDCISQVYKLLRSRSQFVHDQVSRVCDIIEYLSRNDRNKLDHNPTYKVRSRMAANVVFETIARAKQRFHELGIYKQPGTYYNTDHSEALSPFRTWEQPTSLGLEHTLFNGNWDALFEPLF